VDPFAPGQIVSMPPSGAVAGICARTDAERGVHKAPANAIVRGALGLTQTITKADQEVLNPAGVNCLRFFVREGVLLWGARTLARDPEWRYLNVRRLFNFVEESIARGTSWVVFEPNDRPLWKAIRRDIGAFLTLIWRQGALMGSTPEQAFYVKCDEETNPPEVIDAGQVITEVGLAPVKPAEFVVFRIGQSAAGATVEAA
jgi:phage tail sheath protein FI